jgi:regulator of replication initiation timing
MIIKTAMTPAGDEIQIIPDADWLATTGDAPQALRQMSSRLPVLGALWTHGPFKDDSGRATADFHRVAKQLGYKGGTSSINGIINKTTMVPAIERKLNGKRCYEIRLAALPDSWFHKLDGKWPHMNGTKPEKVLTDADIQTTITALPDDDVRHDVDMPLPDLPPADEAIPEYAPPIDLHVASSVAMAMLTQVVEIISAGSPADTDRRVKQLKTDFDDVAQKLHKRLEENDSMRKSIRSLGEEVMALRVERDGLRQRLRMTEANLERATSADTQRFINEQVQAELAKIMQAKPAHRIAGEK